jgi:hypothetical protein
MKLKEVAPVHIHLVGGGVQLGLLGTAATYWPIVDTIGQKWPQYKGLSPTPLAILAYCSLPRVIMMMENLVELRLAGETEYMALEPFVGPKPLFQFLDLL